VIISEVTRMSLIISDSDYDRPKCHATEDCHGRRDRSINWSSSWTCWPAPAATELQTGSQTGDNL